MTSYIKKMMLRSLGEDTLLTALLLGPVLLLSPILASGQVDERFTPYVTDTRGTRVDAIASQPDGKYLVGGSFDSANGQRRPGLVRFNADGSVDESFVPATGGPAQSIHVLADGKIVIGGFQLGGLVNGVSRSGVFRLTSDGSFDPTFGGGSGANGVFGVAPQPDGKVLLFGTFSSVNGVSRRYLARLNSNGTVDTGFNTTINSGSEIHSLLALPDGKIIVGGGFFDFGGVSRRGLARLNHDGSLDTSFTIGSEGSIRALLPQQKGDSLLDPFIFLVRVSREVLW